MPAVASRVPPPPAVPFHTPPVLFTREWRARPQLTKACHIMYAMHFDRCVPLRARFCRMHVSQCRTGSGQRVERCATRVSLRKCKGRQRGVNRASFGQIGCPQQPLNGRQGRSMIVTMSTGCHDDHLSSCAGRSWARPCAGPHAQHAHEQARITLQHARLSCYRSSLQ
jgi:hypothetical protein